jgi:radical SAM superfamily enzyme YgiQ (UPF0313 family)
MNISFVEPKSSAYNIYQYFHLPRLGLPLLATILKQQGHQVMVYSPIVQKISARDYVNILNSQLVGISTTTATTSVGYHLAQALRIARVPVVFGGTHATFLPEEALQYCDYVLRGEAEKSMPQLIEAIQGNRSFAQVEGLSYKRDGEIVHNPLGEHPRNLDELPMVDLSLLRGQHRMHILPLATSRGCPYHCNFCSVTDMFGHRYRVQSIERTMEELKLHRGRGIIFYDDNFAANIPHTKKLLTEMIRQNLHISWSAQVRAEVAKDRELLELMKKSGCLALFIGFESVNEETLKEYNKAQSLEEITLCIGELNRYKIRIHGMFVLGSDKDDISTIRKTVEYAEKTNIGTIQFMALTPFPGTLYHDQLEKENRIFIKNWDLYDGHHVVFEPKLMSPIELQMGILQASARFYSFWRILGALRKFRLATGAFRYGGHLITKGWMKQKRDFMEMLARRSAHSPGKAQRSGKKKKELVFKPKASRPPRKMWRAFDRVGKFFR